MKILGGNRIEKALGVRIEKQLTEKSPFSLGFFFAPTARKRSNRCLRARLSNAYYLQKVVLNTSVFFFCRLGRRVFITDTSPLLGVCAFKREELKTHALLALLALSVTA